MHPSANSAFSSSTFVNTDANANADTTTTTTTSTTSTTTTSHHRASSTTDSALPSSNVGSPSEISRNESEVFGLPHQPGHKHGPSQENSQSSDSGNNSTQAGRNHVSGHLEDQRTKKRRTGPSPRGVANLTPEQLAKKRANDREAQRAIRERTKNQIETLERRIRELTSQKPYQELQAAIRAKEAVEAENAEIKSRLASVLSLIQPILSNQQVEGAYASPISPIPSSQTAQCSPSISHSCNDSTPISAASPSVADSSSQTQSQLHPSPYSTQVMLNQQRHDLFHNLDLGAGEQLKLDFLLDPSHRVNRMPTGINEPQGTAEYQHLHTNHGWNFGLLPRDHSAVNSGPHRQQQHRIEYAPRNVFQPVETSWIGNSAPIKNGPPTCPLDSLLLEFLQERRQRAAEGVPTRDIVGPKYPSVSSLLNPANSVFSHPLSKVFTDILAAFPGISGLPERIAVLYYMFLVMRWQVSPTQENYNLLPHFALPTPAQLHIAHPAWIDHLPFPHMREKLAKEYNPTDFLFDNFFIPFTTTISLNWPYEPTDTLLQSPDGNELLINPVYERHLRRFENWTLGEAFDKAFPLLRGTYNLKRSSPPARNMADGQFSGG
ncbi:uncharacterized protein F4812DRAFT_181860 [Daldinia caldariorum]|uniref:uncharacterized protein n=1 Tax=Daldinia caldariorum TaxID=326644 RepID=UPI002008044E|nr:uncharacterized protein F4812DRAFT_181860 [Daldinia caldariorum]KAI1471525.1 hypothetical protein F4812DRAFT_181860 [Daldinia caldariorum]